MWNFSNFIISQFISWRESILAKFPQFNYRVHNCPPLVQKWSQMNPFHALQWHFFEFHETGLSSTLSFPKCFFTSLFLTKIIWEFLFSACCPHTRPICCSSSALPKYCFVRSASHETLYYPCENVLTVELHFSGHAGDLLWSAGDGGSVVLQGLSSEVHRQDGPLRAPRSQRRLVLVSSVAWTWDCRTSPNTGSHFVWLTD